MYLSKPHLTSQHTLDLPTACHAGSFVASYLFDYVNIALHKSNGKPVVEALDDYSLNSDHRAAFQSSIMYDYTIIIDSEVKYEIQAWRTL